VEGVQIDVDDAAEDRDHLVSPESGLPSRWPGSSGSHEGRELQAIA
jgi:hypothetical protein